jgi:translation initiation factor IF-3
MNEEIRDNEIRVIDVDGSMLGKRLQLLHRAGHYKNLDLKIVLMQYRQLQNNGLWKSGV